MHFPAHLLRGSFHRHSATAPGRPACPYHARAWPVLAMIGLFAVLAGCDRDGKSATGKTTAAAHCVIQNQTNYAWRIVLQAAGAAGNRTELLKPGETRAINPPGGDYAIGQTLLDDAGGSSATRRFDAHLESGRNYRWALTTLLSDPAALTRP